MVGHHSSGAEYLGVALEHRDIVVQRLVLLLEHPLVASQLCKRGALLGLKVAA